MGCKKAALPLTNGFGVVSGSQQKFRRSVPEGHNHWVQICQGLERRVEESSESHVRCKNQSLQQCNSNVTPPCSELFRQCSKMPPSTITWIYIMPTKQWKQANIITPCKIPVSPLQELKKRAKYHKLIDMASDVITLAWHTYIHRSAAHDRLLTKMKNYWEISNIPLKINQTNPTCLLIQSKIHEKSSIFSQRQKH